MCGCNACLEVDHPAVHGCICHVCVRIRELRRYTKHRYRISRVAEGRWMLLDRTTQRRLWERSFPGAVDWYVLLSNA